MMVETVWLDDLKLHDVSDPAYPIALRDANFGSSPEPRASSESRPSADGSVNRTRYWGPKMIELVGYVSDVTPAATATLLEELRAALSLRTAHEIRFRPAGWDEDLAMNVVCASKLDCPAEGWAQILRWGVTLEAPDPRMYATVWQEISYEPGETVAGVIGLDFPLDFPLVFSVTAPPTTAAVLNAWNGGSAPTPVELRVDGPASAVTAIRNETSDEQISLLVGLDEGEQLVVDTATREVTVGGAAAPWVIDASENTWFELQPGENVLTLEGSGFVDNQTRLTARYREARF